MAYVRLTEQAQSELDAIIEYYERADAIGFPEVLEENVIGRIRSLERFPRLGGIVPEIRDEAIREVLYRNYRIVYVADQHSSTARSLVARAKSVIVYRLCIHPKVKGPA